MKQSTHTIPSSAAATQTDVSRSLVIWGVLGAASVAIMGLLEPSLLEEGLMLVIAQRLVDGEHLYRDIEAVTGPFPYELLALAFRVFGEEISVARGLLAVIHGFACAALFDWARRVGSGLFPHLAVLILVAAPPLLFPLFSEYFYTTVACQLAILSGHAALRGLVSTRWALACGVLIALTALSKQTIGVLLALGLLAAVVATAPAGRRLRQVAFVVFGGLLVSALTLGGLALRGELADAINSLVIRPMELGESYSSPYMNFWPIGDFSEDVRHQAILYIPNMYNLFSDGIFGKVAASIIPITQFLFGLPFLVLGATCLHALRRRQLSPGLAIHTATLIALFSNVVPRADWGHLVFVLPSALVQAVFLLGSPLRDETVSRWRKRAAIAFALVLGGGAVATAVALFWMSVPSNYGPRVPQRLVTEQSKNGGIARIIRYLRLHAEPGEPIFVARSEPLIYFATDTTNPTRYGGVLTGRREEQEAIILPALEKVRFIVMSDIDQPLYTFYSDELPGVSRYMERHFDMPHYFRARFESWIYAVARGPDRGPTSSDLWDVRDLGEYWIRNADLSVESAWPPPRLGLHFNRRPLGIRLGARGGGVDFAGIEIPPNAVFQSSVGLENMSSTVDFHKHPKNARLVLWVAREGEEFERLHEQSVFSMNYRRKAGRDWTPFEADLGAYAGETLTFRLEFEVDRRIKPDLVSWFGSPRIAVRQSIE
jgi:hypothetical protein